MKKHEIYVGKVNSIEFPNHGIVTVDGEDKPVMVKNALPGETVKFRLTKNRAEIGQGSFIEIIDKSPYSINAECPHFRKCGGCLYNGFDYSKQLEIKEKQVRHLLGDYVADAVWEGIIPSPVTDSYRNKMEFSFGDEFKGGNLSLGMHKRSSHYDVVTVDNCTLMSEDFRTILKFTLNFFNENNVPFYHTNTHEGYLRNLLLREGKKTGEILVDLITTPDFGCGDTLCKNEESELNIIKDNGNDSKLDVSNNLPNNVELDSNIDINSGKVNPLKDKKNQYVEILSSYKNGLLNLNLNNEIVGILHTRNSAIAEIVRDDGTEILYGRDYFYEGLFDLKFKITPFSFFQTNTLGAEKLYSKVREYIGDIKEKVVYDLYCGTGTITQLMGEVASKVIGVEIVEEAVEAAKVNTALNKLDNCEYIAGDVLQVVDLFSGDDSKYPKPDTIILDPPREGIHPKALPKIIDFDVEDIVYVSCKPTSLARDLEVFHAAGYTVKRAAAVDMFPWTGNVETVVKISREKC